MTTLYRQDLETYQSVKRGFQGDKRRKGAWAVFSYRDDRNREYRKAFWGEKGTHENVFFEIAPLTINQ